MAERIASLLASGTEIVCAIGLADRLVAISHECDYPREVLGKPRATSTTIATDAASGAIDKQVRGLLAAGGPLYRVDEELLASLRPDLIVTQAQCDVCAVRYDDVLRLIRESPALRSTQVVALNPTTFEEIFRDILRVGEAAGRIQAAQALNDSLAARVAAVENVTRSLAAAQRPRVACIEWIDPPMIAANWIPELIELAGGRHHLTHAGLHSAYTSWETVARYDPEVVLVMPCGFDLPRTIEEAEALRHLPGWQDLAAVRAGRVYAVDGNAYFNRSGPRMVDSLEIAAHLIHPELFADSGVLEGEHFRKTDFRPQPSSWAADRAMSL